MDTWKTLFFSYVYIASIMHKYFYSSSFFQPRFILLENLSKKFQLPSNKKYHFFWARAIRKILKWLLLISNPILRNLSWKTYSEYLFCRSNNINDKIGFCQLNKKLGFFVRPINWAECRFLRLKTLNFRESLFLFSGVRKSRFLVQTLVFISQALHIACKPYWKFLL